MQLKPNTTTHTQQFQGTVKAFLFQCFKKKKKTTVFIPMKNTGWLLSKCNIQKKNKAMALKQKKMLWGKSGKSLKATKHFALS